MNSVGKSRMNALTLELRLGSLKRSELMKVRFCLIPFYECFQCCQRGFALLHSIQGSGERNDF